MMRESLKQGVRRFPRARAGNVTVFAALCFPVFLVAAAFAVDEGSLFNERRALQGLADLAATTAAGHPDRPEYAALMSLADNGLTATLASSEGGRFQIGSHGAWAQVTGGRYRAIATIAPEQRFTAGAKPFNAFRVELQREGTRYFSQGMIDVPILRASAIGYADPQAALQVGSRLARLDGGIANAVLGALVGGGINLSVMDYRALVDARVDMLDLADGLAAGLDLKAATYSELLDSTVTLPDLVDTVSRLRGVGPVTAAALRKIARAADRRLSVPLASLFDPGATGSWQVGLRRGPLAASTSVIDLVEAAAGVARGGNQVDVRLDASVPGLLDATLSVAIGERKQGSPWMRVGARDDGVRTAQTRFLLRLRVAGPGGKLGSVLDMPIYGELAYAEAKLSDIACQPGKPAPTRVTVAARPGLAALQIGEVEAAAMTDFRRGPAPRPALLADAGLLKVYGASRVAVESSSSTSLTFLPKDIEGGNVKTVATREPVTSLTGSLIENLELDIQAGPMAIGLPNLLRGQLSHAFREIAEPVDEVLASVLATLGVSVGEADVSVSGGICNRAVLVQ